MPAAVQREAGLKPGDRLEFKVTGRGKITVTAAPAKRMTAAELRANAPQWLKDCWEESRRNGTDKMTMAEINAEIAAYRREKKEAKNKPAP